MKFRALLSLFVALALASSLRAEENNAEVEAHKCALDLAAAFSNDGFKIRDGHWSGAMKSGDRVLVAVNLYAGNQYWFSVGADKKPKKLAIDVYDEGGKQLATEGYDAAETAAAGFSPTASGQYYVAIGLVEGEPTTLCLVYSYK